MRHGKRILILMAIVSASAFIAYRLFADPELRWQEEVRLHDGRVIVADRWEKRQAMGEVGHRGLPLWSETKAKNPNTGTTVRWYEDAGADAYILGFIGDKAYIATRVSFYHPCKKYGFPKRDFVFFKFDGAWKEISFEEFPAALDTNLLFNVWTADSMNRLDKHMTLEKKADYLRSYAPSQDYSVRHLIMNPPKYVRRACEEFAPPAQQ